MPLGFTQKMSFHKTYETAKRNYKPLSRKKGLARKGISVRGKPMNKVGPRTREWQSVWRFLKPRLKAAGRTSCEFDFIEHECWGRLDPCHSKKRREMQGDDIYAVAIGCQNIHTYLDEVCKHEFMEKLVLEAINRHGGLILPKEAR